MQMKLLEIDNHAGVAAAVTDRPAIAARARAASDFVRTRPPARAERAPPDSKAS
jgi:hypothetical protein